MAEREGKVVPTGRLWGLRGAVQVDRNAAVPILAATRELLIELIERNGLDSGDFVSVIPLLCNREMDVPGAMPRVIRVLAHYYAPADHRPEHVYLGATRALRADLHSAQ